MWLKTKEHNQEWLMCLCLMAPGVWILLLKAMNASLEDEKISAASIYALSQQRYVLVLRYDVNWSLYNLVELAWLIQWNLLAKICEKAATTKRLSFQYLSNTHVRSYDMYCNDDEDYMGYSQEASHYMYEDDPMVGALRTPHNRQSADSTQVLVYAGMTLTC